MDARLNCVGYGFAQGAKIANGNTVSHVSVSGTAVFVVGGQLSVVYGRLG